MAQVGSIKLVGDTTVLPPISNQSQTSNNTTVLPPIDVATQAYGRSNDHQHMLDDNHMNSDHTNEDEHEDDDVQIVFSAPRRRRKKRRRYESSISSSPLAQPPQNMSREFPTPNVKASEDPFRRRSTGVVHQLESCHIGESRNIPPRGASVPPESSASISFPAGHTLWGDGGNYDSTQLLLFQPYTSGWWQEPMDMSPSEPASNHTWQPSNGDGTSKKRKRGNATETFPANRPLYRQSTQISPRTSPITMLPLPNYTPFDKSLEMCGNQNGTTTSTIPSWSTFDWNTFAPNNQCNAQAPRTSAPVATNQMGSNLNSQFVQQALHTPQFQQRKHNAGQQPIPQPQPRIGTGTTASRLVQDRQQFTSNNSFNNRPAPVSQTSGDSNPTNQSTFSPLTNQNQQSLPASRASQVPTAAIPRQTTQQNQFSRASAVPHVTPSQDLLRKPSLYKIPPWPNPSPQPPVQQNMTTQPPSNSPQMHNANNIRQNSSFPSGSRPNTPRSVPAQMPPPPPPPRSTNVSTNPTYSSPPPQNIVPTSQARRQSAPVNGDFQIPRARAGRKHSPNLIVDIAETCQEVFPFAAIAERHSTPIQKVFDTFSAVIQLPLLRNADDRRRHGSLGKRRMKEYKDARKAMEKARELDRKAQMKAMRARVDEAAKRGKGQKGLLKAAILNNARENQGSPGSQLGGV